MKDLYYLNKNHYLLIEIQNKINVDDSNNNLYLNNKFQAKAPQALWRWEA